jgi:hypothetical protein
MSGKWGGERGGRGWEGKTNCWRSRCVGMFFKKPKTLFFGGVRFHSNQKIINEDFLDGALVGVDSFRPHNKGGLEI